MVGCAPRALLCGVIIVLAASTIWAGTWTHRTIGQYEYWYLNGSQTAKFRYNNDIGQWWHYSNFGTTSWYTISTTGLSQTFIGDGGWYTLGNGFTYRYYDVYDDGYFKEGTASRFRYGYTSGQWYHSGDTLSWRYLGSSGLSAAFLGSGYLCDLGNGFTYKYYAPYHDGYFKEGDSYRFRYGYTSGQWYHSGDTLSWRLLGSSGLSAAFVGSGSLCDLGNGFSYWYYARYHDGYFKEGDSYRFRYRYASGQWYHSGDTLSWQQLGNSGLSAAFLGSGYLCDLGNGFSYWYYARYHDGYFKEGDSYRFRYGYTSGQWYHSGDTLSWQLLGSSGLSAAFLGSGAWYDLGNGFSYSYTLGDAKGYFKDGDLERFYYSYGSGQWYHSGDTLSWQELGNSGFSAAFLGSGAWYDLGNGFSYSYTHGEAKGYFKDGDLERFYYSYGPGQWYHKGDSTDWAALTATNYSLAFIADGSGHDLGNGFTYSYAGSSNQGNFSAGADERFYYAYGSSQWYHKGDASDWGALTATGVSAQFVGDGGWYNLGNGLTYQYSASNGEGLFKVGTAQRFAYSYGPSQWFHKGDTTDWTALTADGYAAKFIGDGAAYDLGNGFFYHYAQANDRGFYTHDDKERFYYAYGPSRWYHKGDTTDWAALTAGGYSAAFIGDGTDHALGNGFNYSYASNQYGYFKVGGQERFSYNYAPGQWFHRGNTTDWAALTASNYSAAFIGDGAGHYLGDGVSYYYTISGDNGYFKISGHERFWYEYVPSQWRHHRASGGSWADLGAEGVSALYVGDGKWHDIGNGWRYSYTHTSDCGQFNTGDTERFLYRYGSGQWSHKGDRTDWWMPLTSDNYSLAFVGDGAGHDLGNGFSYSYSSSGDAGYFSAGSAERFYYSYAPSQWYHKGDTTDWGALTATGVSAQFVGAGKWHNVGTGHTYQYSTADGKGYFKVGTALRFWYDYGPSQWFHKGNTTDWATLSAKGVSARFVGDGAWHDVGYGFTYQYLKANDEGHFTVNSAQRFFYSYGPSQWSHKGELTSWATLSGTGVSAQFVGDGAEHDLGNGFSYQYVTADEQGYFKVGTALRFAYGYDSSQWSHKGDGTDLGTLSDIGISAAFVGDGDWHDIGYGFTFQYLTANDEGYFKVDAAQRFAYSYGSSQWSHKGDTTAWATLGDTGISAAFVGDGEKHDIGSGLTYQYLGANGEGHFTVGSTERFFYSYAPSQWSHKGDGTSWAWGTLSNTGVSAAFVGDGEKHDLGNGFSYQYVSANNDGLFRHGNNERFYYRYGSSQWYHKGNAVGWAALSNTGVSAQFVGDGADHALGNGFNYSYSSDQHGYFKIGDTERFYYNYAPGKWYHKGNTTDWAELTPLALIPGYSAEFIGDGSTHELVNGVEYYYTLGGDNGWFKVGGQERFWYEYGDGRWHHKGDSTGWGALSAAGVSAQFVGNGTWHALGNGFSYQYVRADKEGYFKGGSTERFLYDYGLSQWSHRGDSTDWGTLSASGVSAEFVGDGGWHNIGTDWNYQYVAANSEGYFKEGDAERFFYGYAASQWSHKGDSTDWGTLSAAGISAAFVGDAAWHDLGNGFSYQYVTADKEGYFKVGSTERFLYGYGLSQWSHKGDSTDWATLTTAGFSAQFVGDGGWHDLGNGFAYQYLTATGLGYFKVGSAQRFAYSYGSSQWAHKGDSTDWATLSAIGVSALFVGDGAWHDTGTGTGWAYQYVAANDAGLFKQGETERFSYGYGASQWSHKGDSTDWGTLSAAGISAEFVGDAAWHDLANGFSYQYVAADKQGYFKVGDTERYLYDYGQSQWSHKGDSTDWGTLSADGVSAAFVGDGGWYDLGNGFTYQYLTATGLGYFKAGTAQRFSYAYGPSQWSHKGNASAWATLGNTGVSAQFVGDGAWHDLGNGFMYSHVGGDSGYFMQGDNLRFSYWYVGSQWFHKGNTTDLATLTAANFAADFVGDGAWHDIGNGFTYKYVGANGEGHFNVGSAERFFYSYVPSQWSHKGDTTAWATLSDTGISAQFVGDGGWHDVGYGFTYQYVGANGEGHFKADSAERFSYSYALSQWSHKGDTTDWGTLSNTGISAQFVGDGAWHNIGYGFTYSHVGGDSGYFKQDDNVRFSYWYVGSQWFHKGNTTDLTTLTAANFSADFVGDGAWHDLGNGFTYSHVGGDSGYFKVGNAVRFSYWYVGSQWFHRGNHTDMVALTQGDYSAAFIGDGAQHDLGNGWLYSYLSTSDYGAFSDQDGYGAFAYSYTPGQWYHKSKNATDWAALTTTNYSIGFIGDGEWHDIGTGWSYSYGGASVGTFKTGDTERFAYSYGPSQWLHKGNWDGGGWGTFSGTGVSAQFVGDGEWHDLGNGFTYQYLTGNDTGYFRLGSDGRFSFGYGPSQWFHRGNATDWIALTAADYSPQFVGDGGSYDVGNGWTYHYILTDDRGCYSQDGTQRFAYSYGPSQWLHKGDNTDWGTLSATGVSLEFIGDGAWHDLGNGFNYSYTPVDDYYVGYFRDEVDNVNEGRFAFAYVEGYWYHTTRHWDWVLLSDWGGSAQFVGDDGWHYMGSGWWYSYDPDGHTGYWARNAGDHERFYYTYTIGLWQHKGDWGFFHPLGTSGWWDPSFLGDGELHHVRGSDDNMADYEYWYDYGADKGYWRNKVDDTVRWKYYYDTGDWYHFQDWGHNWHHKNGPEASTQLHNPGVGND